MNKVQTNIMSVTPAPNTATKANAADAVRPMNQAGATADRVPKKPSFDRTLAKLKDSKQDVAEAPETMAKDPLMASIAASQQKQTESAASAGSKEIPETGKTAAEARVPGEALEVVQVPEENASAESAAVASFDVRQSEDAGAAVEQTAPADVQPAWMTPFQKRGAEPASAAIVPMDSVASRVEEAVSTADATPDAADLHGNHGAAHQKNALRLDNLAVLLPQSEKPVMQNLLQTLSGRNLLQSMQAAATSETLAATPVTESSVEELLPLTETAASLQPQTNLPASEAEKAVLPDALLRALVQQPVGQTAEASSDAGTVLQDAAILPQKPDDTSMGQGMTEEGSDDGFAGLLNRQQMPQEQKAQEQKVQREDLSQAEPMQPLEDGTARTKVTFPVQSFGEAVHNSQESSSQTTQANPAVSFQTTLQEAAEVQPTAPAAPQKDYEVAKQIVEQARLLRMPEQTEMVIRLKPEHLGELTLKVSVAASGAVNAAFHTDNASVRAIIETSMIQLKHELQAQGLKVDNVGVYAGLGDHSMMNGQQDADAHYAQHGGQGSSQGRDAQQALASFEEEQQALAAGAQQGVLAQDGVDYRI
ncbi:flagellar hook-length control protein FliK [Selenomonas sputigena]|uniref:flagellar hook-length control protein FliK n=1 Tax=Selenomonas sputigena TaxID=69823 RepID=UPI00222EEDC1|nr:flagellar hook-length control protein FliK [Selenomonas sputigena]UZD43167.1 flagellar hook-length control protein FliK [Selenomonas sputigena]